MREGVESKLPKIEHYLLSAYKKNPKTKRSLVAPLIEQTKAAEGLMDRSPNGWPIDNICSDVKAAGLKLMGGR